MLTTAGAIASIAVMAVVTFLTRALPFLLFDRGTAPPKLILYLGRVLPPRHHRHAHHLLPEGSLLCPGGGLAAPAHFSGSGGGPPSVAA